MRQQFFRLWPFLAHVSVNRVPWFVSRSLALIGLSMCLSGMAHAQWRHSGASGVAYDYSVMFRDSGPSNSLEEIRDKALQACMAWSQGKAWWCQFSSWGVEFQGGSLDRYHASITIVGAGTTIYHAYWDLPLTCPDGQEPGEDEHGFPMCAEATGSGGTAQLSVPDCQPTAVGQTSVCGDVVVTAAGGPITLPSFASSVSITGPGAEHFFYHPSVNNPCPSGGGVLAEGASCSLGTLEYHPTTEGDHSATLTVTPTDGNGASVGFIGEASYSYSWVAEEWGACDDGAGTWVPGTWSPTLGCGETEQSRTVTCVIEAGSGTQVRDVSCVRSDGQDGAGNCDLGTKPADSQSCTPTDPNVCDAGSKPPESRTETLNNTCDLVNAIQAACAATPEEDFCVVVGL